MTHAELTAAGYDVDAATYARLQRFVALLLEENRRLNLTSLRDEPDVWRAHVCDSLALVPLVRERRPRRLLDLGTGGGLPGVPLACVCRDLHVTLLDATRKKLAAVERIVAGVGLSNVEFAWGRAETLARQTQFRERYEAVTARAVAELRVLIECTSGFVRPHGAAWFFKTPKACVAEVPGAEQAARTCHMAYAGAHSYRLPGEKTDRVIATYQKLAPLPADLPRPPGRARKRPL